MRAWLKLWGLSLLLVAVLGAEEGGVPVRLQDWGIADAAQILRGELVFEQPGGGYVADLTSNQGPAVADSDPCQILTVLEARSYGPDGGLPVWQGNRLSWNQQTTAHLGATLKLGPLGPGAGGELALWIRGRGTVELALADPAWEARQDAIGVGKMELSEDWALWRVAIPGQLQPSLVRFALQGEGWLEWASLCRVQAFRAACPPPQLRKPQGLKAASGCWIWDSEARLESDPSWIDFLQQRQVQVLFLQQPPRLDQRLQTLIARLHAAGMQVQALNGDRHDVLPEARPAVSERLQQLARYQQEAPPECRFDGLHYDVEPYLLAGFPVRRGQVLGQYLHLVESLCEQGRTLGLPVVFDLPFWFDQIPLELGGRQASVVEHVLERADGVALMSYRTRAEEVLEITAGSRAAAARLGKPCWISLETVPLPDERSYRFEGPPRRGTPGPQEVVFHEGQFWLGPNQRSGWCWKLQAPTTRSADRISFARLPLGDFQKVRESLLQQAPLAVHDLTSWLRLERP